MLPLDVRHVFPTEDRWCSDFFFFSFPRLVGESTEEEGSGEQQVEREGHPTQPCWHATHSEEAGGSLSQEKHAWAQGLSTGNAGLLAFHARVRSTHTPIAQVTNPDCSILDLDQVELPPPPPPQNMSCSFARPSASLSPHSSDSIRKGLPGSGCQLFPQSQARTERENPRKQGEVEHNTNPQQVQAGGRAPRVSTRPEGLQSFKCLSIDPYITVEAQAENVRNFPPVL